MSSALLKVIEHVSGDIGRILQQGAVPHALHRRPYEGRVAMTPVVSHVTRRGAMEQSAIAPSVARSTPFARSAMFKKPPRAKLGGGRALSPTLWEDFAWKGKAG